MQYFLIHYRYRNPDDAEAKGWAPGQMLIVTDGEGGEDGAMAVATTRLQEINAAWEAEEIAFEFEVGEAQAGAQITDEVLEENLMGVDLTPYGFDDD